MMSLQELPDGYGELFSINLQKDKKLAVLINLIAVAIAVLMVVPMLYIVPISALFDMEQGLFAYFLRFAAIIVFVVLYMVLHELVHGVTMKLCGTKKVKYGFTGMYAFAGSDDFYDKRSYIAIALAPVVVFAIIFAVVSLFVSDEWFWVVYFLQITNISGAAGDLYVTARFSKLPSDILVKDCGIGMTVYSKK